ncbi:DUF6252 family protein [Dyadobacter luticola]|uniref:Uncharacterized protein n=1 Tax=Dyadobacter luticola TaxID=1979387 RepID=A0A5R9L136_9BACT|nr:DUF6252 family protein [Dyadobacter luticola]TLV02131.1 hypothetical protein FEN17_00350 [Dyadobacter luticola]
MKASQFVLFFAFVALLGFSSCSKKSDDVTPDPATVVGFKVKVDGKVYAPDYAYALAESPGTANYYTIYGLDSKTSDVIAIALPNTLGEGTHPINATNFGIVNYNKEELSTVNGGTGTVTITKKTATQIMGTFSFTAQDATGKITRTLTEGSFNVNVRN